MDAGSRLPARAALSLKKNIQPFVGRSLAAGTRGVDAVASLAPWRYVRLPTFEIDGYEVAHFIHRYNAYCPPYRMTERTVELALADMFLRVLGTEDVAEVGAVTPYYWPGRIATVVDPTDAHERVTTHAGWNEWSHDSFAILSMSTFEHIGAGEYGLAPDGNETRAAIDKLLTVTRPFLVTFPAGYNATLDAYVRSTLADDPTVRVMAWHRGTRGNNWRQLAYANVTSAMETYGPAWANTLIALYRGPADLWARAASGEASRPA